MAMSKIERIDKEIQKTREKITEYQNRLRGLEAQKTEAENLQIVQLVRSMRLTPQELTAMLAGGGIPGNMNNLMKQAQKMQRQMEENQKALEEKEFTAAAGGGVVEVTISGKKEVTKVSLKEEVVDPDDIEMLEDLIMAATNEALRKVEEETNAVMSKLTGGLTGMGGGFPF